MTPRTAVIAALLATLGGCAPGAAPAPSPPPAVAERPAASEYWSPPAAPAPRPLSASEYAGRRAALAAHMQDGVLVVFGSPAPAEDYLPYAQNANFRYLTGIVEPDAALVIEKRGGRVNQTLFVRPRDPAREVWEGKRLGAEGARARTGIPSRPVSELFAALTPLLDRHRRLYTVTELPQEGADSGLFTATEQRLRALTEEWPGVEVVGLTGQISRLRADKSERELELLRRAIWLTVLAQREAMRAVRPGLNEFEVQALIEYTFRRNGADGSAFSSIVGSGPNATTLHYRDADRFMGAEELLLMDIGASFRGYAGDLTRTIPVSGTFSPAQRALYEVVLAAQKAAEGELHPGATWQELNDAADRVLAEGLARLGLIDAPDATYRCESPRFGDQCPQYRLFYMHGLGHGIGLEVHDPDVSYFGPFEPGSAFTIEPGLYVRADALDFLPDTPENRAMIGRLRPAVDRYRGLGVRIEDNYLVTPDGFERVSRGAPREIAEVERLMAEPATAGSPRRSEVVEWYRETEPLR
ncbi:MAG: aminopeptidase P family protein [Longimicrobiaceae bacterium]